MPSTEHVVRHQISQSFRVAKVQGLFDIPAQSEQVRRWYVDVPDPSEDWRIGVIVGPSGSGKSQIARKVFGDAIVDGFDWTDNALVDDFPKALSVDDVAGALSAVGLSSTPSWLLPYRHLSTGQQFRATLARSLVESSLIAFDEYTSVVDRVVAKASSVAVAKWIRRSPDKRFIAVSCHYDILPWLEPDWVLDMATGETERRRLWRPSIDVSIHEGGRESWPLFRSHHYLSGQLHKSCRAFTAEVSLDGQTALAGFFSLLPVAGHKGWWRGHRTVVLPDFQGMGIGNRMIETVAELLYQREGKRFRATTGARPLNEHRRRNPEMWRLADRPRMKPPAKGTGSHRPADVSAGRLTTTWVYIPEALRAPSGQSS